MRKFLLWPLIFGCILYFLAFAGCVGGPPAEGARQSPETKKSKKEKSASPGKEKKADADSPILPARSTDEENAKTNTIDTCGIKLKSGLRFADVGQNEEDRGQHDEAKIIGPSGAAGMYRIAALEKIKRDEEFFDELMFMYKEDCDIAYRLSLKEFSSKCVSDALVYHDRSASSWGEDDWQVAMNRKNKTRQVKKWSFLNQQIIFIKYWKLQNFKNKLAIILYKIKMIVFILLFEQYLLRQLVELSKIKNNIKRY